MWWRLALAGIVVGIVFSTKVAIFLTVILLLICVFTWKQRGNFGFFPTPPTGQMILFFVAIPVVSGLLIGVFCATWLGLSFSGVWSAVLR